ncbi:MAG: FeoB-associated Cys-rich membrane protein [Spirochaetaceae bacterium]|jgi:hypothetical protein|nr:FeoB-associated Cys-rich membrane protein [Spirochaetaceae bacterium]
MEFVQHNAGNIIVGIIVLAAAVFAVLRIAGGVKKRKGGCGGCSGVKNNPR